ncbi:MAG: hypothetical protein ACOY6E_01245 [Pseudomonadota bacterium]
MEKVAETVGSVVSAVGRITVVTELGQTRELRVSDAVHADEMLVVALESAVTLRLTNGRRLDLEAGTVAVLDSDVCDTGDGFDDGSAHLSDVQQVLGWASRASRGAVA